MCITIVLRAKDPLTLALAMDELRATIRIFFSICEEMYLIREQTISRTGCRKASKKNTFRRERGRETKGIMGKYA